MVSKPKIRDVRMYIRIYIHILIYSLYTCMYIIHLYERMWAKNKNNLINCKKGIPMAVRESHEIVTCA